MAFVELSLRISNSVVDSLITTTLCTIKSLLLVLIRVLYPLFIRDARHVTEFKYGISNRILTGFSASTKGIFAVVV
jgi:hypothetical protein